MSNHKSNQSRYKIAETDELAGEGNRVITEVAGKEIAVFKLDDEYYGVLNYCCHQSGPLCEGELTGYMSGGDDGWEWVYHDDKKIINCPWHSWRFDITTGENIDDNRYRVPTYEIEEDDGDLYVCF